MKNVNFGRFLTSNVILLFTVFVSTCAEEEKEVMAVGGLVALDYATPLDNFDQQSLTVGRIELRAVVNVNKNVKGFITLLTEGDLHKIRVYQAATDLTLDKIPLEIIAGQQIFDHGLMTTRLINYPLGYGFILPNQPGVTAQYMLGNLKICAAGLMIESGTEPRKGTIITMEGDTTMVDWAAPASTNSIGGIMSADYSFLGSSVAHFSTLISREKTDLDVACALTIKKLTFDGEIYRQLRMHLENGKAFTYCAGVSYAINDIVSVAFRNDGLSADRFKDMTMLYAAGFVVKIFNDCYFASEYNYTKPANILGINAIALEFGLQSTLKLPGFQRKTLTNGD